MSGIELEKGKFIYTPGQPLTALHLITNGSVKVRFPGGDYSIGKGDVIGICEICSEIHFLEYETQDTTALITYPLPNMESLSDLLQEHPDVASLFVISSFRQVSALLKHCDLSELACTNFYHDLVGDYKKYQTFCQRYRLTPRVLEGYDEIEAFLGDETPDLWINGYYLGLLRIFTGSSSKQFVQDSAVSLGLLRKSSLDFRKTYASLEEQHHYLQQIRSLYFHENGNDLFDFYTSLFYKVGQNSPDIKELYTIIKRILTPSQKGSDSDTALVRSRSESFLKNVQMLNQSSAQTEEDDSTDVLAKLAGSLNTILHFAGNDLEVAASFREHVLKYKTLSDKNSMDDSVSKLRRSLTQEFYTLYAAVFEQTLHSASIPMPVKMFLYFGYVDEELAGQENCVTLYRLAESMKSNPESGVYTFYDWLLAIFHGDKEPSRNEFDQDYNDYIHKQRAGGNITDKELRALENNTMGKVNYELRNMFPVTNKMTFGRITTFCPLFTEDNVLKNLSASQVTAATIGQAIERIKDVDYTAFYRESLDMEHIDLMGKELIHVEYLPDVILMPNIGIRGVMWQEIEGKRRSSPSRMMFSIFHMEDVFTTMVHLTGEFRWELCKRVQGARWNDLTDRSLTSEYYDYIQFYRKSHDLSSEAKEKIRSSLQRAKNSFKEMFVRDYLMWVLFEGSGAPRLNKVARQIFFTYCPFTAAICDSLQQNPLYNELLSRREIQISRKLHHLDMLQQKILNSGAKLPDTVESERKYITGV